ncbi:MAG: T9SS type A sorting domain-containing protein, partial [Bacteriodetes bacterium]|nr:T9SS type A sorting domain-containing protein [Bacteroidota bacterium]
QTITISVSGSYTVKVTNSGGCTAVSSPTVVTVNPTPAKPIITEVNKQLTSSASNGYQWIAGTTDIPGATQQTYAPSTNGKYRVRVKNSNGCESTSDAYDFITNSVIEDGETAGLTLQPNPASESITFSITTEREEEVEVTILNLTGQEVLHINMGNQSGRIGKTMELENMASGVYTLRLRMGSRIIARTFVVQK